MRKHEVKMLIPEDKVEARIVELAAQISRDYEGRTIHLISILKGGVMFLCELAKHITVPVTMDFMSCTSYGEGTVSRGVVRLTKDLDHPIKGRDVLIVEDIVDTGYTLAYLMDLLKRRHPASLRVASLLNKNARRVEKGVHPDYTGFEIDDIFVVGYGMDYDQAYRNLPYIGYIVFTE